MSSPVDIRSMLDSDWIAVCEIYDEGIATGVATFETVVPEWDRWDAAHVRKPRLVAETDGLVSAWAVLSPVSARAVYQGVAEVTIYVAATARRQGIGKLLLERLIAESEEAGFWTLQSVIFFANSASINLHQACGFRVVGKRERIGQLHGVWHDTVLMERRSQVVGR